jgi:phosphatidylserine/phosphatidylglycerophosphate/cardiolipin synthase-like enzyme
MPHRSNSRRLLPAALVASAIALVAPSLLRAQVEVYFTRPVDTTLSSSPENRAHHEADVSVVVARIIGSARVSIDMAMYNINVQRVVDALIAAHRRGVRVRVVGHVENITNAASRFQQLAGVGIPIIANPRAASGEIQPLMHNKFLVVDARAGGDSVPTVVTGSWNATFAQTLEDANNVVVISDRAVAGAYLAEFEEMWGSTRDAPNPGAARFGASKRDNTEHVFTLPDGTRVDVYFSPSDAVESRIRGAISTAQTSLLAAALTITSGTLASQIGLQKSRGADARVLVENIDDQGSQYQTLAGTVDAHSTASVPGLLHHKYAIADAMPVGAGSVPLVVTGSHNWTYSANAMNDENTLIIYSAAIANQYLQEFAARYREAGGDRPFGVASIAGAAAAERRSIYPNPFASVVRLSQPLPCDAEYALFDPLGREIAHGVLGVGESVVTPGEGSMIEGVHLFRIVECDGSVRSIPLLRMPEASP